MYDLLKLEELKDRPKWDATYSDSLKRLKGLFSQIPELAKLPLINKTHLQLWKTLLAATETPVTKWLAFSKTKNGCEVALRKAKPKKP